MRDSSATRAKLLQAAMTVFAETGYAGATTRAIAERAGVNEVTLFRHFGAKADLMVEAMGVAASKLMPELVAPTGDLEADLVRIVRVYQDIANARARFIVTVLSEVPRFPELKGAVDVPRRFIGAAAAIITSYQQSGMLRPEPPVVVAASLLTPILFLAMVREAAPDIAKAAVIDPVQHVRNFLGGHAAPAKAARKAKPRGSKGGRR